MDKTATCPGEFIMVSFLSMALKSIVTAFLYLVKAFFSMITWFLKALLKVFKLFFVFLPVTAVVFILLMVLSITMIFGVHFPADLVSSINPDLGVKFQTLLNNDYKNLLFIGLNLYVWWGSTVDSYKGSWIYFLLILLTIIMFVPVISVFLCWSVLSTFGPVLFGAIVVDAVLYVIRALFGQTFITQARSRLGRLFPKVGVKNAERDYTRNLKKRNKALKDELKEQKQRKWDSYYDEVYGDDEEFDEEYDEEYDDHYE